MDQKVLTELLKSPKTLGPSKGKLELRTAHLPHPPKPVDGGGIRRLRTRLRMSQAVFARYLNVSTKLVQAWESNRLRPDGPALLLVRLVERNPALVLTRTLDKPGPPQAKHNSRRADRTRRLR